MNIQAYLEALPYDQDNPPELYSPIKHGNVLYVFGQCAGVALVEGMMFDLVEDDGHWHINDYMSSYWLNDKIEVLQVLNKYIDNHAN